MKLRFTLRLEQDIKCRYNLFPPFEHLSLGNWQEECTDHFPPVTSGITEDKMRTEVVFLCEGPALILPPLSSVGTICLGIKLRNI